METRIEECANSLLDVGEKKKKKNRECNLPALTSGLMI
jgi:hypothetical protein